MGYSKDYNNHRNEYKKIELEKIVLDYENNEQLFGKIAKDWSKQIDNEGTKSNQIRSFYDKILELQEKSEGMSDEQYKKEVSPFVIMLKSKVAYAKTRNLVGDTFVKMINQCVDEVTSVKKMQNFKYFFEAIIGFYPKK